MSITLPNLLSVARMALIPLFIIAVVEGKPRQALILFLVAGVTDLLDGAIARLFNQQSTLGKYLDPAADKMLLTAAYVCLAVPGVVRTGIPVWVTVLVITRDVMIVVIALILYLAHDVRRFEPSPVSKVNTAVQIAAVVVVLAEAVVARFDLAAVVAVHVAAVLTVASGLDYFWRLNGLIAAAKRNG